MFVSLLLSFPMLPFLSSGEVDCKEMGDCVPGSGSASTDLCLPALDYLRRCSQVWWQSYTGTNWAWETVLTSGPMLGGLYEHSRTCGKSNGDNLHCQRVAIWTPSRPANGGKTEEIKTLRPKERVGKCEFSKPSSNILKATLILS